jgi:hypothetical protein
MFCALAAVAAHSRKTATIASFTPEHLTGEVLIFTKLLFPAPLALDPFFSTPAAQTKNRHQ